jgi:branched-chain amino acid transport system substrate-binding protein
MNQMTKILLTCIFSLFILTGCVESQLAIQREKDAGQGEQIVVGVPVPLDFARENTKFLQGLDLALEDINAEGINGKKISLEVVDDEGNFKTAVDVAQQFSQNTRMAAVIGHWYSDICLPVANIYEDAGMLMVVPTVSNPELTEKGYKYVIQSITNDKKIAEKMCAHAKNMGYKRAVICYEESSYGKNLAEAIEKEAAANNIKIVDRSSGLVTEEQFKKACDKWKALEYEAVLLALNMPEGATYISELKKMHQNIGIISADGLDVSNFIELLGKDAEGVVIITTYSPYSKRRELDEFTQKYQVKYNEEPDVWAIQGYESLQLIAHAIKQTNSVSAAALADYLRSMDPWLSVSGNIHFNEYGEIIGRDVYQKAVVNGQFQYLD